jgi:hypothetical protein
MQHKKLLRVLSVPLLIILLSGCSSHRAETNSSLNQEAVQGLVGTGGKLIPIASENVRAAGYDSANEIMTVQFTNGAVYKYFQVPKSLWEEFLAAQPHPWSQVGYPELVQAGVAYRRVE